METTIDRSVSPSFPPPLASKGFCVHLATSAIPRFQDGVTRADIDLYVYSPRRSSCWLLLRNSSLLAFTLKESGPWAPVHQGEQKIHSSLLQWELTDWSELSESTMDGKNWPSSSEQCPPLPPVHVTREPSCVLLSPGTQARQPFVLRGSALTPKLFRRAKRSPFPFPIARQHWSTHFTARTYLWFWLRIALSCFSFSHVTYSWANLPC